jgi:GDP-L-fucose synthase
MTPDSRIYVVGSGTFVGSAIVRRLSDADFTNVVDRRDEPDVASRDAVDRFFVRHRPEYVFVAASRPHGIAGHMRRAADVMLDNLLLASHLIPAASQHGVRKLLYLSGSCIYPRNARQPLQPSSLGTGPVDPASATYAAAALAGVRLCDAFRHQYRAPFITAIAADAYGPGDDFSADAHVAAALIRRMHEAKQAGAPVVDVWGSGRPRREFIYVDDLADACVFVMGYYDGADPINLGTCISTSIADLAVMIRDVVGYRGELRFDRSKPDGMPLKGLDSTPLHGMGWQPSWDLRRGLAQTYESVASLRSAALEGWQA